MRFHSITFSLAMNLPTAALVYDTKVAELFRRIRDKHRCVFIRVNELDVVRLREAVEGLSIFLNYQYLTHYSTGTFKYR